MKWLPSWVRRVRKEHGTGARNSIEEKQLESKLESKVPEEENECNSYRKGRWQEESVTVNFPVWANIGFIPKEDEFLCLNINFDTELLEYIREKKDALASIRLEEDEGEEEQLVCKTQVIKVGLKGLLIGNVTMSVFKPVEDLSLKNEHYISKTAFCKTQFVPIDMMLGIRCLQCEFAPLPEHKIYIKVNNPYVVKSDGEKIYAYEEGMTIWEQAPLNKEFVKQFDGETMRLVYIPLTIGVDFEHIVDQTIKVVDAAYKNAFPMDGASISIFIEEDDETTRI